ncbi:tRNA1(Val) (adenine(37)-N6)-methyltransferase [Belliella kenyensis]|uniref:tRNA1(Val) (adenine(37)-N6)-methyltransferase n=1 Tax=Belliella kenyensis TaxID=1472724 RepID=A0ABV8EP71_9BACT|nr:methyltransferase [Belliella kenyensis]MCH7402820.1 methyltransferase [Belliella kenyensis]MDN3602526.1 methyltransferase [Belliella kenyensis]
MKDSSFRFKQFIVKQDQSGMKISTDAVLLGALVGGCSFKKVLDIGTGTGVIALMLAQRLPDAQIDAIEIDPKAYSQAKGNFTESPFSDRLKISQGAIQEYYHRRNSAYDLIVSNPPYYPDHLKSPNQQKNQAMHTDSLSFDDLVGSVDRLLQDDGEFWLILPSRQMNEFTQLAIKCNLYPKSSISIHDKSERPPIRYIQCFARKVQSVIEDQVIIKQSDGMYTTQYSELLKEFLIIF